MTIKFELGRCIMTRSVDDWLTLNPTLSSDVMACLDRHHAGDWGDVGEDDKRENDFSIENGLRVLSAYTIEGVKIWIITEADRSVTTILFPEDY